LSPAKLVTGRVVSNEELWPGSYLLWAEAPEIARAACPGQYVMVRCGEGYDMPLRRPLSVHNSSADGRVAFLFMVVGCGTEWLAQRKEGDPLDLLGPLGNGFEIYPQSRNLLLVAGGIGIAPMVALAADAVAAGRSVTLVIGDRTSARICPERLLPRGIKSVAVTEDGSEGVSGMATDLLPELARDVDQLFACGPVAMYQAMSQMSDALGGKPAQVLLEVVLGCGVGACLGCTIQTKHGQRLVCKDGPVFELDDIVWDKGTAPSRGRRC
jgi:dihydroorotate dehydrogenase electron transfer subunit